MDNMHQVFVTDVKNAMEDFIRKSNERIPSTSFKPSGMHCKRVMYFVGKGYQPAPSQVHYNWNEAARTGSLRHEAIQDILEKITNDDKYNWEYIDVGKYVDDKHKEGKCLEVEVGEKKGMETHLYNKTLNLSFLCDGIVKYKPTNQYFLFEFKNKKHEKFMTEQFSFPMEHYDQVVCYCMCLDLEDAFLLMEDRNTLELSCPETFHTTEEMKTEMRNKILDVLSHMERNELPEKCANSKDCFFCPYKQYCK